MIRPHRVWHLAARFAAPVTLTPRIGIVQFVDPFLCVGRHEAFHSCSRDERVRPIRIPFVFIARRPQPPHGFSCSAAGPVGLPLVVRRG